MQGLEGLDEEMAIQLSSTNMEFIQEGDELYCFGGYGYSSLENDHTTFAAMIAIHLPTVVEAIVSGEAPTEGFRQFNDEEFQVTGGRVLKIGEVFYLLGGQDFQGRYNPMGPDFGPGFFQEYTDAVRRFEISDDGEVLGVTHLEAFESSEHLHRRDYNALPQIMPDGSEAITMFSGVFHPETDLPFLYPVDVFDGGFTAQESFLQYFNHYHCASLSLHSNTSESSYNLFFGGMARYYDDGGLVEDDNVPFVKSIACVTRDSDGLLAEELLPIEMPALLGAGSEFIPNPDLAVFSNGVLDFDALADEAVLLGHVFGGIESTAENIFFINDGNQSSAHNTLYEVWISPGGSTGMHEASNLRHGEMRMEVYPIPAHGKLHVKVGLGAPDQLTFSLMDNSGRLVLERAPEQLAAGEHLLTIEVPETMQGQFLLHMEGRFQVVDQKVILE